MTDKPEKLEEFCRTCSEELSPLNDNDSRIALVTSLLEPLLADRELFRSLLENVAQGRSYPDIRYPTMFENELILHLDPAGQFSLRIYLWAPGEYDPVHDHNSWGVIGPVTGRLKVRNFENRNDGSSPIMETERRIIPAGKTYRVLPLDEGIHQTGNPTDTTVVQVSVYGKKQTDRSFINLFDEVSGRIYQLYSPPLRKRMLAEKALSDMTDSA